MKIEFKTARNSYGSRKYLFIDFDERWYTRNNPKMVVDGIEIKTRDYNEMVNKLDNEGFTEVVSL